MRLYNMCKQGALVAATTLLSLGSVVAQEQPREWAAENYEKYSAEAAECRDQAKLDDVERLRKEFQKTGWRKHQYGHTQTTWQQASDLLLEDGTFKDVEAEIVAFHSSNDHKSLQQIEAYHKTITEVWNRIGKMADGVATGKVSIDEIYTERYMRAIIHYTELELSRSNYTSRFHTSCFAIPTAATNIYYALLDKMEAVESGADVSDLERECCLMLKTVALQAWTQPLRQDETDNDVSSIDRFRKHVWWVGGNGLSYRSLLPVACMIRSVPMLDVLAEVAQRGVSCTSQTTYDTSFWTEGITADGAGWGHGMQCLVWGYPIDGNLAALGTLNAFKGSVWETTLNEENKAAIFNYVRGSSWYHYKGFNLPCLDRSSFAYISKPIKIKSALLAKSALSDWRSSFTDVEIAELEQFVAQTDAMDIQMEGYEAGYYNGTRYFFNNDDLIKRNDDYHVMINMASIRCDGLESAAPLDVFNFTPCDGMTLFQRKGNEYKSMYGAFDVLQAPGITARLGMDKLTPLRTWDGFCSKHNYAGAATLGGENAVAGYIFEKMNGSYKTETGDKSGRAAGNEIIYGVEAYKSYFMIGDYMLALGAGVTNLKADEFEEHIRTSIEQTALESEVYLLKGGRKSAIKSGENRLNSDKKSLEWLVQKGQFAYTSLPDQSANSYYLTETRECDWVRVHPANANVADRPKQAQVLQLWVDHGHAPVDDTYGYVVYMGKGEPASKLPFEVLSNSEKLQAVATTDGKIIEAVFYEAGELKVGKRTISVSEPSVLLMESDGKGWRVSLTDSQMRSDLKSITLTVDGVEHNIELPEGLFCGEPAKTTI